MTIRNGSGKGCSRWAVAAGLAFVAWAAAARADTFLIISLVGDHLTVVTRAQSVGSHADANRYETVPLAGSELDDFAVRTAGAVVGKARPADKVEMLRAVDPTLRKMSGSWLDADSVNVRDLVSLVADLFKPPSDSHLLLIAPYRDQLQLKTDREYRGGEAKAAGLGFYIDGSTRMHGEKLNSGVGFLGVFANFQLVLIDLQSSAVEARQRVVVGTTFAAADAPDRTPWNALAAEKKVATLQWLMKRETERLLPEMLGSAKK
jgi:hypothetical protein